MRQRDDVRMIVDVGARKIADIGGKFLGIERSKHRRFVHHAFAREVEQHGAMLGVSQHIGVDHLARGIDQRHMHRNEVGVLQHFTHAVGLLHLRRQAPGCINGDLGIVAKYVHSQLDRHVSDQAADLAEADHAQRMAGQFEARKVFLAVLDLLLHRRICWIEGGNEAHRAADVPCRQQHAGDHQLLDGVGISAGRIEHRHAASRHRLDRDVVGSGAGATDGLHRLRNLHRMHVGGAHHDRIGLGDVLADVVAFRRQPLEAVLGYLVEDQDVDRISHA